MLRTCHFQSAILCILCGDIIHDDELNIHHHLVLLEKVHVRLIQFYHVVMSFIIMVS
jgi:hypothetical protein